MYVFCIYIIVLDGVAGRRSCWLRFLSAIPTALPLPKSHWDLLCLFRFITGNAWPSHKEVALCKLSYEAPWPLFFEGSTGQHPPKQGPTSIEKQGPYLWVDSGLGLRLWATDVARSEPCGGGIFPFFFGGKKITICLDDWFKGIVGSNFNVEKITPPKFNMEPEKWWLEDESPFGIAYFQVPC